MKAILTALFLCFLLVSCEGFVVVSGGPPDAIVFDQETFDAERAAWQKQRRTTYVFNQTLYAASPKPEITRTVVEAGTISAYTALEYPYETTITKIYSDLASEVQRKRADYEAGKTAGARIVVNYTAEHYPSSIYSAIRSSEETGLIAGGYYQRRISDLGSVIKPDQGATSDKYPIEFDEAKFEEECAAWQTQDYVFEIEHRDYLAMSRKFKWVVENGAVTAVYDWDYNEWKPIPIPEVEDDHVFERLIGIYTNLKSQKYYDYNCNSL
ncbi:MAG: hypothetical protein LBF83_03540 [Spirochaetaceae bacterium]|jgi:hypothetical protein|nr:hypothetical protein [Spirochaetaceae bacterium]